MGAGIVGAACAEALARDGHRVTIVDASYAGGGTTAAGMGHLVVMDDSSAQFDLTALSVKLWSARRADLPARVEYDACGTLWVAKDAEEYEIVTTKAAAYADRGVETEVVGSRRLAEMEPNLRPGLSGALRVLGDAVIYPTVATLSILGAATRHGATLFERRPVQRIEGSTVVFHDQSSLAADIAVNAAGAHAAELTPGLSIEPRRGHLAITDRYPGFAHHQVLELGYLKSAHSTKGPSVAFNVQPRKTGQLLIGSSREYVGWESGLNRDLFSQMLNRGFDYMPALRHVAIDRIWTGFRPSTPDKLPLIGSVSDGHWVAAGHEGLGIATSLGTAALLADLIGGRTPLIDPSPFDARRFQVANA